MEHVLGPIGGLLGPSPQPLPEGTAPILFGGERPKRFFVTPTTTFQQQEDRNSCVAHGFSAPIENLVRGLGRVLQVCRADLYSGALYLDGSEGRDNGVTLGSMGRWIKQKGILPEYVRPYKTDDVTRRTPSGHDGDRILGLDPVTLPVDVDAVKDAVLVSGGCPFGQPVTDSYKPDSKGVIAVPSGSLRGYHCTEIEGWDDDLGLLNRESWLNFGIDHPLAGVDPRFAHLIGKRGFTWRPFSWFGATFKGEKAIFEPTYHKGTLIGVE